MLFWSKWWHQKDISKLTDLYTSPFSIHLHRFDLKWNSTIFTFKSRHVQKCCVLTYISSAYCFYFSDHQTVQLIKDKRSNSCFSESSEPGSLKNGAEQGRRPSRAFLIKQRDSGEETLVTLTPVGGRQNVPTIVGPQFSKGMQGYFRVHQVWCKQTYKNFLKNALKSS